MGKIIAVCLSKKNSIQNGIWLIELFGLDGDARAGKWRRLVGLLAREKAPDIKDCDGGEMLLRMVSA